MDFCVAELLWWAFGFALAFGAGTSGVFGLSHWLYGGEGGASAATFFLFQLMFCGTSATIVSGAVAERVTFSGYVVITLVISAVVYPLSAHRSEELRVGKVCVSKCRPRFAQFPNTTNI